MEDDILCDRLLNSFYLSEISKINGIKIKNIQIHSMCSTTDSNIVEVYFYYKKLFKKTNNMTRVNIKNFPSYVRKIKLQSLNEKI